MASGIDRPYFLDLLAIRFPIGAICSIAHRISGVALAACLPFAIYAFGRSLESAEGYAIVTACLRSIPGKTVAILFAWALGYHALAGVRHLLMDIDVGSSLAAARRSAWLCLAGGAVIAAVSAALLA